MGSSRENFQRLVCLQVDGVSQVLRMLLVCCVGRETYKDIKDLNQGDIAVFIQKHKDHWETLKPNKLDDEQFDLLTGVHFNTAKLDITLLCLVLLYGKACKLGGTERGHIKALKDLRNRTYGHAPNTSVDESTFHQIWRKLEYNLLELAKIVEKDKRGRRGYQQEVADMINKFKQSPLKELEDKMIDILIQWMQLQNAENRRNKVMENLFDYSEKYLNDQDSSQSVGARILHSKTLFDELKEKLVEYKPVALAGLDKEIVELLAKELAKEVKGEDGKCLTRSVSDEWSAVEFEQISVLLLFVDETKWWYWAKLKDCLKIKSLKLIMIYAEEREKREIKRQFHSCYVKEVQSDIFTDDEKVNILQETLQKAGIQAVPLKECVNEFKSPIGFLQICQELLRPEPQLATDVQALFRAPFKFLSTILEDFTNPSDSSTLAISVNVLFFYKGQLDISNMPADYENVVLDILTTTCSNTNLRPNLKKDFDKLDRFVVDHHTTTETLFLPMMYEVVAMKYAEENPVKAIECCTQDFLLKHVAFDQPVGNEVLVSLDRIPKMINAVANRLFEDVYILIKTANDTNGVDQATTAGIRCLLRNKLFSHSFVIDAFLARFEEETSATPAHSHADGLYCAVVHGDCDIVAKIVAGRKEMKRWDEHSKGVAIAVLEAYISREEIYDTLVESGTLTILQYLAVFTKEGDKKSLNRLVKTVKNTEYWDETSPYVLNALKDVVTMKDIHTCKSILDNGVVFDTMFICHAVNTGDERLIKMMVSHLKAVLKQNIDPLCTELTESMVNTDSPDYKAVCEYLQKKGAMSPFKLIQVKVVDDKNFKGAIELIKMLRGKTVWEEKDADIQQTMIWLLDNWHDTDEHELVLEELLGAGVYIVSEIQESVFQTNNLMCMRRILPVAIRQGNIDKSSLVFQKFVEVAKANNDIVLQDLLDVKTYVQDEHKHRALQ